MFKISSILLERFQIRCSKIRDGIRQVIWTKTLSRQVHLFRPCSRCQCLQNASECGQKRISGVRYVSSEHSDERTRAKRLLLATYGSIATGGVLLLAVIWREIDKGQQRMKGINRIKDPLLGSRPKMILFKDVMLPNFVEKTISDIEQFQAREDDIWIVSFPRSGTTWTQEIVYLIHTGLDLKTASERTLEERFPYFEYVYPGIKVLTDAPSPRLIKTHLPYRLLPKDLDIKKPKIIYVARNPKDVCVSYFHFVELLKPAFGFKGNFKDFFDRFIGNKVPYSPWWRHVTEFWEVKDSPNILYLKYEDMITDLEGNIKKIAAFLGKSLKEEEVKLIARHCSFDQMKNNDNVNCEWWKQYGICDTNGPDFIRKGKIGQWKTYLTPEMNLKVDQMLALKVQDTGLAFYHGGTLDISDNESELSDLHGVETNNTTT